MMYNEEKCQMLAIKLWLLTYPRPDKKILGEEGRSDVALVWRPMSYNSKKSSEKQFISLNCKVCSTTVVIPDSA